MPADNRIAELEQQIARLPAGSVVYKTINGKKQPYLQWKENGKTKSRYLGAAIRDDIIPKVALRKELSEELRELKSSHIALCSRANKPAFHSRVVTGDGLNCLIDAVKGLEKRDCYRKLEKYLHGKTFGRVCLLYGLRRTGKTTLLLQAISELSDEDRARAAYIKAQATDTISDISSDLAELEGQGYQFVFIDEVTLMSDFIDSAALFSDIHAVLGTKIVLSGADSLGFWFALAQELYDRAFTIHTTHITFQEYRRLLGADSIDEYIRYGGTLMGGRDAFNGGDALKSDAVFRNAESTQRYIDTAISNNIQHSVNHCDSSNYSRHLRALCESGELAVAVNRAIESMNREFLLQILTERSKALGLGSAAELPPKHPGKAKRPCIRDQVDRKSVSAKLMELLANRNQEYERSDVESAHTAEIMKYLKALDLIVDRPSESMTSAASSECVLFTQPGMRYCQVEALIHDLLRDKLFASFSEQEKRLACEELLEGVREAMMREVVLLDTACAAPRNKRVFKLNLSRGWLDMVIYDSETDTCKVFEVKHSAEIVEKPYSVLTDEDICTSTERRFGSIVGKTVIYRGADTELENGITYQNVENYLTSL